MNGKEHGRRAVESDRLEQRLRCIHQKHDARPAGSSQLKVRIVRKAEFLYNAEAGIPEHAPNHRHRSLDRFTNETNVAGSCKFIGATILIHAQALHRPFRSVTQPGWGASQSLRLPPRCATELPIVRRQSLFPPRPDPGRPGFAPGFWFRRRRLRQQYAAAESLLPTDERWRYFSTSGSGSTKRILQGRVTIPRDCFRRLATSSCPTTLSPRLASDRRMASIAPAYGSRMQ